MRPVLVAAALLLGACLESSTVVCANGVVCPAAYACDAETGGCVSPGECFGLPDNTPSGSTCGIGACQRDVLCIGGFASCEPGAPQATDVPDASFIDADCDGIDGQLGAALFVAEDGDDDAAGTIDAPLATVQVAIDRASPGMQILVSNGTYAGFALRTGVSVFGGYSRADLWARRPEYNAAIEGGELVIECSAQTDVVLDHLFVRSSHATSGAGASSYAIRLASCERIELRHLTLVAGDGANGSDGARGMDGGDGADGGAGAGGGCYSVIVGAGGASCDGLHDGGDGGSPGRGTSAGGDGTDGFGIMPGTGGVGGSCARNTTSSCGGDTDCFNGLLGLAGAPGAAGMPGAGGSAFNEASVQSYLPSDGAPGIDGSVGDGGGGGGGGHGGDNYALGSPCGTNIYGSGGAGGGGGACAGTGGSPGTGGGGSFAVWASGGGDITIVDSSIETGLGGRGGIGAPGGYGGRGGRGGDGLNYNLDGQLDGGCGGNGGNGGDGGRGGEGGGGGGGPSIGVVFVGCAICSIMTTELSVGGGGSGGFGGTTGADGLSADHIER